MPQPFKERLNDYFNNIASVLSGKASVASIFPNTTDIGIAREKLYAKFLEQHLPSSCNVFMGGFLFNMEGEESKQIDLIITNDVSPKYNFMNEDDGGKAFACVDGCIGVASIKSNLDTCGLIDTLENLASIPKQKPLGGNVNPYIEVSDYEDWPLKIVYATKGAKFETIKKTLDDFYKENPNIPYSRKPNIIHVLGKYCFIRTHPEGGQRTPEGEDVPGNVFYPIIDKPDVYALSLAVSFMQGHAQTSQHIIFRYNEIIDKLIIT